MLQWKLQIKLKANEFQNTEIGACGHKLTILLVLPASFKQLMMSWSIEGLGTQQQMHVNSFGKHKSKHNTSSLTQIQSGSHQIQPHD